MRFCRDGVERCSTPTLFRPSGWLLLKRLEVADRLRRRSLQGRRRQRARAAKMGPKRCRYLVSGKIIHAWQSGLFESAVEKFHDVHDVLAGFVDFGAGAQLQ